MRRAGFPPTLAAAPKAWRIAAPLISVAPLLSATLAGGLVAGAAHAADPGAPAAASAKPQPLLLDVRVNGQRLDDVISAWRLGDGRIALPDAAWAETRLVRPRDSLALPGGGMAAALDAVPGLTYALDMRLLRLEITAPPAAFAASSFDASASAAAPPARPEPGAVLNYDAVAGLPRSRSAVGATLEGIVFGPFGSVVASALVSSRQDGGAGGAGHGRFARLDTYWQMDFPERMESLVVGDTVGSGGGWSRPVRYGGVRIGRDFSLRPGYITVPQASINGSAALPSAIEVLVNGQQRMSQAVAPGAFEVTHVPLVSGAGEVNLVVRDLLGRETVVRQGYYASPRLLAPGLSDWQAEAGKLRTGYGDGAGAGAGTYGDAYGALTWRRGLTPQLTAELRTEWMRDRQAAGVELSGVLGDWAAGRAFLAQSRARETPASAGDPLTGLPAAPGQPARSGAHAGASLERSTASGGWSLMWEGFARGYTQLAAVPGEVAPRERLQAGVQAPLWNGAGGALSFTRQRSWNAAAASVLGATVGMPLPWRANLSLSFSKQYGAQAGWRAGAVVTMALGDGSNAAASFDRAGDGRLAATLQANQAAPAGLGQGWYLRATNDDSAAMAGGAYLNTRWADFVAEVEAARGGQSAARLGARGSIGFFDGLAFAARPLGREPFAIVRTGDVEGVPVLRSHQVVARTGPSGYALVPGLLPWETNAIEIDPSELPLDLVFTRAVIDVVPWARSGVTADFGLRRSRNALVRLLLDDGSEVPAGALVSFAGADAANDAGAPSFTVARRGEVYLSGLQKDNVLEVTWPGQRCYARVGPPATEGADGGERIGPLSCLARRAL